VATAQETFQNIVIDPLRVSIDGVVYSYADYLALPASQRSNDEAAFVDIQFTQNLLKWLGFDAADITYNRPLSTSPGDKPDFLVQVQGAFAFVVEDKSSDERFNEASIKQLRRYTAGTSGYSIWTNGKTLLALRFDPNGHYQTLVEVRVDEVFGKQLLPFSQEANFAILHLLFHKQRFMNIASLIDMLAVPLEQWQRLAKPITGEASLKTFITESRSVLDQLVIAIKARLTTTEIELAEAVQEQTEGQRQYALIITRLIDQLRGVVRPNVLSNLESQLRLYETVLTKIDILQIERLKPTMGSATATAWNNRIKEISAVISMLNEQEQAHDEARRIRRAYTIWRERYRVIESEDSGIEPEVEQRRQQAFAEQVSYVFFVRLLLTRVLEDKGIIDHLVSDGGFEQWYAFLKDYAANEINSETFLPLVYRRVASFYRHFFQQPVFDWFIPDDYLLALTLHHLSQYDFKDVSSDLLGFTYEAFIDRVARNKKGHFLTPPDVVEFMLDRSGYNGPQIIGESLIDIACGSGSFLVHGARRLRQALATAMHNRTPLERARTFIDQVQTKIIGLEINPFSCYLAELNLFIQVLDDLRLLWQHNEHPNIERFAIYNTNSLEMPQAVLYSGQDNRATTFDDADATFDEGYATKVRQGHFSYVISNPPYINRGIIAGAKSYGDFPFYQNVVKGDENFYLLFLRLAAYYVVPGGTICFICPLNLLGDESTMRTRELFATADWSLQSLTRFYARDVLFPGVLQGVCIVRFDHAPGQPADMIELRGGFSVEETVHTITQVKRSRITGSYPDQPTWSKPWLVNLNHDAYDLWDYVNHNHQQDLYSLMKDKLKVREGDARSTWAKPMIVPRRGKKTVPLTKGKNITNWGGWTPAAYLDPTVTIPTTIKDYTSCLWVQRQVERIANLAQPETALFLKEISGLEMKRPLRGTIIQRDQHNPVAADHTVLVMYTLDPIYTDLAYAVFGLIISALFNFLFSLFSTNAHANFKEILRLPVPEWSADLEQRLASKTRSVQHVYQSLYAHEDTYGSDQEQRVSLNDVLRETRLPTLRLEELVLRGEVIMSGGPQYTLDVLLDRGQLTINPQLSDSVRQAIERIIRANGSQPYGKSGKDILICHPRVAQTFLAQLENAERERTGRVQAAAQAQHEIDALVLDLFGITQPSWRETVEAGVPWARE
jgi:type I restriction-modification system DNA methylase subunit